MTHTVLHGQEPTSAWVERWSHLVPQGASVLDVACGHGATAGDLNHDHVFYLKSRGIPEAEAKALLIAAFVGEAFDAIHHDGVREARFLIGAADGHGDAARNQADLLLGFGPMTWPHLMVRAMLAEQLWRATSILAGHPYHRSG